MNDDTPTTRSPGLAFAGVLALLVSLWGLADGPRFLADASYVPWLVLGIGLVVGLILIISGFRR